MIGIVRIYSFVLCLRERIVLRGGEGYEEEGRDELGGCGSSTKPIPLEPHGGHRGVKSTLVKVSQNYTWNGMRQNIHGYA